jgi:hypothetical protein
MYFMWMMLYFHVNRRLRDFASVLLLLIMVSLLVQYLMSMMSDLAAAVIQYIL